MAIQNTIIGTTNTTLYSSSGNNAITTIIICNTAVYSPSNPTSGEAMLYVYAVPNGVNPPSFAQLIINGLPIPAGETVSLDQEKMVLSNGDSIVAYATNTNLSATVSTLPV